VGRAGARPRRAAALLPLAHRAQPAAAKPPSPPALEEPIAPVVVAVPKPRAIAPPALDDPAVPAAPVDADATAVAAGGPLARAAKPPKPAPRRRRDREELDAMVPVVPPNEP
jgi:hypothetical protein